MLCAKAGLPAITATKALLPAIKAGAYFLKKAGLLWIALIIVISLFSTKYEWLIRKSNPIRCDSNGEINGDWSLRFLSDAEGTVFTFVG